MMCKSIISARLTRFRKDETGTTLVEFAICISLFLLLLFAVLDFGRLGYSWVVAEKAMQKAVRIAAVRPPVCPGVPLYHRANGANASEPAGTLCSKGGGICEQVNVQCRLSEPDAGSPDAIETASDMWAALVNLMPTGTQPSNILLSYNYDRRLGFVGGPYVPVITARVIGADADSELPFEFVTPLSALAATAGASNTENMFEGVDSCTTCIPFPGISVTLPAEDMNQGMKG